jgi:hypothetical protein
MSSAIHGRPTTYALATAVPGDGLMAEREAVIGDPVRDLAIAELVSAERPIELLGEVRSLAAHDEDAAGARNAVPRRQVLKDVQ